MGSTSSKDHDAHPSELGTNTNYKTASQQCSQPNIQKKVSANKLYPPQVLSSHLFLPPTPNKTSHSGAELNASSNISQANDNHHTTKTARNATEGTQDAMAIENFTYDDIMKLKSVTQVRDSVTSSSVSSTNHLQEQDLVPMVFKWEHGGRHVYITGTFNNWSKQMPMHRSGNDFTYITNLTRGKHAYKFVVDEEWRFAPDQLTVADVDGDVNNFVDVSNFIPLSDIVVLKKQKQLGSENRDEKINDDEYSDSRLEVSDGYGRYIPDIDEYTKEPPPLPPHLRHIILNKAPPTVDCRLLPIPQHVALNHLYCTAIKDGMMILGITQRYKQKFVTTVYYSLMPGTN